MQIGAFQISIRSCSWHKQQWWWWWWRQLIKFNDTGLESACVIAFGVEDEAVGTKRNKVAFPNHYKLAPNGRPETHRHHFIIDGQVWPFFCHCFQSNGISFPVSTFFLLLLSPARFIPFVSTPANFFLSLFPPSKKHLNFIVMTIDHRTGNGRIGINNSECSRQNALCIMISFYLP